MATEAKSDLTILVIEDSEIARASLAAVLRAAGYHVVTAADGQEGLDQLHAGCRPALILLDMLMPVLDGWRFLEIVRRGPHPLRIPVVVVTGTILTREWAQQHGCAGFLRKPFGADELLAEVQRCVHR